MTKVYELENIIQDYAWGDKNALNELFGIKNPDNKPQAEIWMGAHPKAPSTVVDGDKRVSLIDFVSENPEAVLGKQVSADFAGKLPFLYKVLSAGEPLSIQSHPTLEQAKVGFAKDNAAGIELTAFNRNYKDDNHKPELICALTPFKAMNGFREISEIIALFEELNLSSVNEALELFRAAPTKEGLKTFYTWMMNLDEESVKTLTAEAIAACESHKGNLAFETLLFLNTFYSNDIGIMCAVMLNVVELKPGEAVYLDAGELHAYIQGTGMEIMANSDNVLRGGLTPKFVDVPELLSTLSFNSGKVTILTPQATATSGESIYPTPVPEFDFSVINVDGGTYESTTDRTVEILFCGKGEGVITAGGAETKLAPGKSFLVPASVVSYTITGDVTVFKGNVPE